jgi:hypothetical protein
MPIDQAVNYVAVHISSDFSSPVDQAEAFEPYQQPAG